jgi:hypothetical protein
MDEPFGMNVGAAPALSHSRRATFLSFEPDDSPWADTGVNIQIMCSISILVSPFAMSPYTGWSAPPPGRRAGLRALSSPPVRDKSPVPSA